MKFSGPCSLQRGAQRGAVNMRRVCETREGLDSQMAQSEKRQDNRVYSYLKKTAANIKELDQLFSFIGKCFSKIMNFENQQGKSLKYTSEICNLPSLSSLEAEGKAVSGHEIYEISNINQECSWQPGPVVK